MTQPVVGLFITLQLATDLSVFALKKFLLGCATVINNNPKNTKTHVTRLTTG